MAVSNRGRDVIHPNEPRHASISKQRERVERPLCLCARVGCTMTPNEQSGIQDLCAYISIIQFTDNHKSFDRTFVQAGPLREGKSVPDVY